MTASLLKKSLYDLIEQIEDVELLAAVYKIIASSQPSDWWKEISSQEQDLIKKGLKEADNGEVIPHKEVMQEVRSILKRKG